MPASDTPPLPILTGRPDLSQAHYIITRDSTVADAYRRIYPMVEQKWRPRMAIDKVRRALSLVDTTRRHTHSQPLVGFWFSQ